MIYGFLRGSEYDNHDKTGYKFFTFSDIFPFYDLKKNDIRNLIIASPNPGVTSYLKEQFDYIQYIQIGQMNFKIDYVNEFNIILPERVFTLITETPILCQVRKYMYEQIGASQFVNGHDAYYWRSNHPVELFIKQLESNLIKKYNQYHGLESNIDEEEPIFYKSRFLKQLSTRLSFSKTADRRITVIGTKWEFDFGASSQLIQFALDTGFGELNSMGFGFMNVKSGKVGCHNLFKMINIK